MSHLPVTEDDLKAARRAIINKRPTPKGEKGYQPLHAVIDDPFWYRPEPEKKEDEGSVILDIF